MGRREATATEVTTQTAAITTASALRCSGSAACSAIACALPTRPIWPSRSGGSRASYASSVSEVGPRPVSSGRCRRRPSVAALTAATAAAEYKGPRRWVERPY